VQHSVVHDATACKLVPCRCGPWFGKICCCIVAVDLLLLYLLAWLRPAADVDVAPDYPAGSNALGQAGAPPTSSKGVQQNVDTDLQAGVLTKPARIRSGDQKRPGMMPPSNGKLLSQRQSCRTRRSKGQSRGAEQD
jgi:hypothetical protein